MGEPLAVLSPVSLRVSTGDVGASSAPKTWVPEVDPGSGEGGGGSDDGGERQRPELLFDLRGGLVGENAVSPFPFLLLSPSKGGGGGLSPLSFQVWDPRRWPLRLLDRQRAQLFPLQRREELGL